jgi:PadR family transcriptional regulator, regulatory protein AphA
VKAITLTPTSYVVLGLVSLAGEATPYDLKQMVARSVGHFWSIPHSQLYAEPARLAEAGYLKERRESHGRRRKHYSLTASGRRALEQWTAGGSEEGWELRDPGLLKLFFGADPAALAREQLEIHQRQLASYEQMLDGAESAPPGPRLSLEAGIGHEREYVRFWSKVAEGRKSGKTGL